jgi:hypothetical protein
MTGKVAYEAYKTILKSHTRNWFELKEKSEHKGRSDEGFDRWLKDNESDKLNRYFMGDYESMPAHTKAGWDAFADKAGEGAEVAWNNYVTVAKLNFHKVLPLPNFMELMLDQQAALKAAVSCVLESIAEPTGPSF